MDHKLARSLFMDYIYEEMDEKQRREFEKYVSQHPDLQEELAELGDTRAILSFLPVEEPTEKLVIVPPAITQEQPKAKIWTLHQVSRYAGIAAAFILMAFLGAAISEWQRPEVEQGYTAAQVQQIVDETVERVRADNAQFVADFVSTSLNQQREEFNKSLVDFASLYQDQRLQDLEYLSTVFDRIQQSTLQQFAVADQKFRETDQVLGDIIETVSLDN